VFHHVKGKLIEKRPTHAVVEAGGVGYLLRISVACYDQLPEINAECTLLTCMLVRDDAHELVGFANASQRDIFKALLSVNGVGANLALAVLSAMQPSDLARAISDGNSKAFKRVKGLGPKKAERIILELRGKIETTCALDGTATQSSKSGTTSGDAISALVSLGYKYPDAETAVVKAARELGEQASTSELIRLALVHTR
jgi:holliday junction DNA helicase RuvA